MQATFQVSNAYSWGRVLRDPLRTWPWRSAHTRGDQVLAGPGDALPSSSCLPRQQAAGPSSCLPRQQARIKLMMAVSHRRGGLPLGCSSRQLRLLAGGT